MQNIVVERSNVLLWTTNHGYTSFGRPVKIYIYELCAGLNKESGIRKTTGLFFRLKKILLKVV